MTGVSVWGIMYQACKSVYESRVWWKLYVLFLPKNWQIMIQMINAGHISESTFDKICTYLSLSLSVLSTLLCLVQDQKWGGHQMLQISTKAMDF